MTQIIYLIKSYEFALTVLSSTEMLYENEFIYCNQQKTVDMNIFSIPLKFKFVATTKTTFLSLRSANSERPQRQRARLFGCVWLETYSIYFSSIKPTFVYYTVNIS